MNFYEFLYEKIKLLLTKFSEFLKAYSALNALLRFFHKVWFRFWQHKSYYFRAIIGLSIGFLSLIIEDHPKYDLRFQIRGERKHRQDIILIQINDDDWSSFQNEIPKVTRSLREVSDFSDSFYWRSQFWQNLLQSILKADPKAIGVTFYFGDYVHTVQMNQTMRDIFFHPKLIWAGDVDSSERIILPGLANDTHENVGLKSIVLDEDGILRRYSSMNSIPFFSDKLVEAANTNSNLDTDKLDSDPDKTNFISINFVGPENSFKFFRLKEIMRPEFDFEQFRDKIIIIGSHSPNFDQILTPVGRLSRAEVFANIAENILEQNHIKRSSNSFYFAYLICILIISLWIIQTYPQGVALVILFWLTTLLGSLSIWTFDSSSYWLPFFSPAIQIVATYIIFLSYQLAIGEKKNWRLQEQQRYVEQLETLKSNFVSMMSHDLKTPIAKIQAIVDRWLSKSEDPLLVDDLKKLRLFSDELHRYIRSILQVSRVEAKDFQLHKEVTDINENILKVLARLKPLADEKQIQIDTRLEPMFSLEFDITLIEEVIANLIENAIKYTPEKGIICIYSQDDGENVFVRVIDNGPGIPKDEIDKVWTRFIRGSNQMDTKGTGLGLYLVKYFVELHKGEVFIESKMATPQSPDSGTTIGFKLPVNL